jgi:hypothetical protein
MFKLFQLFILAICFYMTINWFLIPNFNFFKQIEHMNIYSALGCSAFFIALSILFGDK